jgi:hypothetical protein
VEVASGHYPLIVAEHAACLVSLWVFGRDQRVNFVAFIGVLQGFRFIQLCGGCRRDRNTSAGSWSPHVVAVFPILNAAVLAIRSGD